MTDSNRELRLTYVGSLAGFREHLNALVYAYGGQEYELDLTATIARHPAGKGLRPADPPPTPRTRLAGRTVWCGCPPHEYAVAGHRASCPLGGAG